jgi:hypothetical protein
LVLLEPISLRFWSHLGPLHWFLCFGNESIWSNLLLSAFLSKKYFFHKTWERNFCQSSLKTKLECHFHDYVLVVSIFSFCAGFLDQSTQIGFRILCSGVSFLIILQYSWPSNQALRRLNCNFTIDNSAFPLLSGPRIEGLWKKGAAFILRYSICQTWPNRGPRAACGPPEIFCGPRSKFKLCTNQLFDPILYKNIWI